jgi:hypothetical protein
MKASSRGAGADADIEHIAPGDRGDDRVDHGLGIAGPGPVVALGVRTERLGHLTGVMRLARREAWR